MALELNRIQLAGRLTKDVETKTLPNGTIIAQTSVAVGREYTAKGQEKQSDFFTVKSFSKGAEFLAKWFKKGSPIYIEGSLQTSNWTDKDGQKHYATDIIADKVKFVESAKNNAPETHQPNTPTATTPKFETVDTSSDLPF